MNAFTPSVATARPLTAPLLLLLGLVAVGVTLMGLSAVLGGATISPLADPMGWLAGLDADSLADTAEVVAAVLAVAVTVVAIVVDLAANRYSHEITRLFLREPVNIIVLGLFAITTLMLIWVATMLGESAPDALVPNAGFALALGLVTLCLLLLIPYVFFVFAFLSPISVIGRICRDAYKVILRARHGNLPRSQARVEEAIDELQDVARSAISQGDRGIAMAGVDTLAGLVSDYVRIRHRLPEGWFAITAKVAADADFIALSPETMEEVESQGIWVERKVFRRYLSLMGQCAVHQRDVANLIGINTQRIACEFGAGHPHLLELCVRSFNSYLRTTINLKDPRTAYFLMNQYRIIAERMLADGKQGVAVKIAGYLSFYGQWAHTMGISFLLETAAYDIMQLIEYALEHQPDAVDPLLTCLLELDQVIKEESQEQSLLGVRRCQMQLATRFLAHGDEARAQRIVDDLRTERLERLERLRDGLLSDERAQFWELSDRGVNFSYLDPERRPYLEPLFQRLREPTPALV
ncbi:MAG: DUF2254 family protein, partial [Pseudomonadales bacterium]